MHTTSSDISRLNSLLSGELSAVGIYREAFDHLDQSTHRLVLRECRSSHAHRVTILRRHISDLGGTPSDRSCAWGDFATLADGPTKIRCERSAMAAIEGCEDHGCSAYERGLDDLTPTAKFFILRQFVPEQERTRAAVDRLQRQVLGRESTERPVGRGAPMGTPAVATSLFSAVALLMGSGC